jgi:Dyp-type peroxidase family
MIWGLDHGDIQGLAFYSYSEHPFSKYLHVALAHDDPRTFAWLRTLVPEVRHTRDAKERDFREQALETVHVAFTANGLCAFGLTHEEIEPFPREFLLGMNDDERSRKLGDSQAKWEFGAKRHASIDAVVMLYARSEDGLANLVANQTRRLEGAGARILHEDEARLFPDKHEHFGFLDGISEPYVDGGPRERKKRPSSQSVPLGELLLGYKDAYGETPAPPKVRGFDLGTNGTFLVYRKFRQYVATFWATMRKHAHPRDGEQAPDAAIRLAASMVGRWPDGTPVVLYPEGPKGAKEPANDFGYRDVDPKGYLCPIGSHMRRAYPRDMLQPSASESLTETTRHRLFRRGRPYGPRIAEPPWAYLGEEDNVRRGLVFIALCASLRRQFEFVQQTWVSSYKFAGLQDERDPMIGGVGAPKLQGFPPDRGLFTVQGEPVRRCVSGLPNFVELQGGAYFFLPGIRAMKWLADPRK